MAMLLLGGMLFLTATFYIFLLNDPHSNIHTNPHSNPIDIHKKQEIERIDYGLHPVEEKKWGEIYSPLRIWCMVPTLYPRNEKNMKVQTERE